MHDNCYIPVHYMLIWSTIICYQLTCYHLQSKSVATSLQFYRHICYQTHSLSTKLRSLSFAIKPHLHSGLNCYLTFYQANLLSILSYNQKFYNQSSFAIQFSTCSQSLILPIFFLKIRKKWKISQNFEFFILWHIWVVMEPARFVASSKGTNIVRFFKYDKMKI